MFDEHQPDKTNGHGKASNNPRSLGLRLGEMYNGSQLPARRVMVIVLAIIAGVIATSMMGCTTAHPDAGYQAVLVQKPYFFGHGGVDPQPVQSGLTYVAPSTQVIYVCMQPIQQEVKLDDLMTRDGVPVSFDAVIRVQVQDAVDLIRRFGEQWYQNNVERQFANLIRQSVRNRGLNEVAIDSSAVDAIDHEVATGMEQYLKQINMPVSLVAVTVGRAIPPDAIKNQRIETAEQQQRIITEGQKKLAEDARKAAETSRADADNAYRNAMNMSPDQYLELMRINMQHDACTNGDAHCTLILNGSRSSTILDAK
jgi:regulator of protease activity HflC (stomatin/prohibitin superfamily)